MMMMILTERQTVKLPVSDHPKRQAEVVAYESLHHIGSNSLAYGNCKYLPHVLNVLLECKVSFEKSLSLSIEIFPSLREVKDKRKLQTLSSKSGCRRLREVAAYKRLQI